MNYTYRTLIFSALIVLKTPFVFAQLTADVITTVPPGPIFAARWITIIVPIRSCAIDGLDLNTFPRPTYSPSPPTPLGVVRQLSITSHEDAPQCSAPVWNAVSGYPVEIGGLYPQNYTITFTRGKNLIEQKTLSFTVIDTASANKYALENPQPNSYQSGIGIISGWACMPNNLTVKIDGGVALRVPGGSARGDTLAGCQHSNTGFGLLVNYNDMKAGTHTIQLLSTDPVYSSEVVSFTVTPPGGDSAPFLSGLNKEVSIPGFPLTGKTTSLIWQQSLQNFAIKAVN